MPSYAATPGPSRQPDAPPSYGDVMRPVDDKEKIPLQAHQGPLATQPSTASPDVVLQIDPPAAPGDSNLDDLDPRGGFRGIIVLLIVIGIGLCAWDVEYRRYRRSGEFIPDKTTLGRDKAASDRTITGGIMLGIGILCYLIDALTTDFARIMCYDYDDCLDEHLENVKNGKPKLTWHITCFHRDIETRVINDPEAGPRTETRSDVITTWSGTQEFQFSSWSDETTDQTDHLSGFSRIRFQKTFVLADVATQKAYSAQKQAFIDANRHRDTEFTIQDIFEIEGYRCKLTVLTSRSGLWCCGYLFLVVSFLLYPWLCCWADCWDPVEFTHVKKLSV